MPFSFDLNSQGYLKKRESFDLEYKQNFQLGDNLLKYIKTMVGMANNRGGEIVFGIQDSPHILLGMTNNKFVATDPKTIDTKIREYFEPSLRWEAKEIEFDGKTFGVISVREAQEKPVVCKRNKDNILREGAVYYRYRGETKEIEYAELRKLLDGEKEKERILWIKHIEKIRMVGPRNIEILDLCNAELSYGDHKILLEEGLIEKLNVIKEGSFTEKEGEGIPVLKLVGEIDGFVNSEQVVVNPETIYPLTTKQTQEKLGVNQYEMQAIIYSLKLKCKPKYHIEIMNGKNSIHKYTDKVVSVVQALFERNGREECLSQWKEEYQQERKSKTRK